MYQDCENGEAVRKGGYNYENCEEVRKVGYNYENDEGVCRHITRTTWKCLKVDTIKRTRKKCVEVDTVTRTMNKTCVEADSYENDEEMHIA